MKKLLFLMVIFGFNANLYADRESTVSGEERISEQGYASSVASDKIPGQPIDLPKRPVVYTIGPNGSPGIIDPPRGPWPVTRPIHITRELDDGRGGVIVREIVPDFEEIPDNCTDPTVVCNTANNLPTNNSGVSTPASREESEVSVPPTSGVIHVRRDAETVPGWSQVNPENIHGEISSEDPADVIVTRQLEPMFSVTTEECDRGGTVGLICSYNQNQELVASTASNLQSALLTLKNAGLEITPEGVLVAGGVVGAIALVARYARSINPLGAFALGLGVAPVAASDYCSMYSSDQGFEYFVNELSNEQQIQEFEVCPALSQKVVDFAVQVQEAQN